LSNERISGAALVRENAHIMGSHMSLVTGEAVFLLNQLYYWSRVHNAPAADLGDTPDHLKDTQDNI
jgi:hypothetical protein